MKTKEELNELKEGAEAPEKRLRELPDGALEQVAGGHADITFDDIMQLINEGKDFLAREYFHLVQYILAPLEAYTIRMAFLTKFGYPIDYIGG